MTLCINVNNMFNSSWHITRQREGTGPAQQAYEAEKTQHHIDKCFVVIVFFFGGSGSSFTKACVLKFFQVVDVLAVKSGIMILPSLLHRI